MDLSKNQRHINILILICVSIIPLIFIPFSRFFELFYGRKTYEHIILYDFFYEPKAIILTLLTIVFLVILFRNRQNFNEIFQVDRININLFFYVIILFISLFFALDVRLAIQGRPYRVDGFSTMLVYFLLFIAARTSK